MSPVSRLAHLSRDSEVASIGDKKQIKQFYNHVCYCGAHFTNLGLSINNRSLKFP